MRTVLVVAVLAMIGVATFLLTRDDEVPGVPVSPAPTAEEVQPALQEPVVHVVSAPLALDAAVPEVTEADAGVVPTPVLFDVRRDGVHAVGTRVTVSREGRSVSGLVNVMGGLTLPLEPGLWRVQGDEFAPQNFLVGAQVRVVALTVRTQKTVKGRVVDTDDKPVADVAIEASGDTWCARRSDANGRFECTSWDSTVEVRVEDRRFASESVTAELPIEFLTLVVEPKYPLVISFSGASRVGVQVSHRLGHSYFECEAPVCVASAPTGDLQILATGESAGGLVMARAGRTQGRKGLRVTLSFTPAQPVRGVVTNAEGKLLADVPLEMRPAMSVGSQGGAYAVSELTGAFEFSPLKAGSSVSPGFVSPSWRISPVAPWTGETKYVSFGDAPITLVAEVPRSE
ncbi:MAG: hypothetical protein ACO1OB_23475 [Archangium sp.]